LSAAAGGLGGGWQERPAASGAMASPDPNTRPGLKDRALRIVFPPRHSYLVPLPHGSGLSLGERPLVMGVLNVTPDSFADAERFSAGRAIEAALEMESAGADIVDVGGESTRPGSAAVPADEELRRILPVLRGLAGRLKIPLSVDTYKADVARAAVGEGATLVNDISGLRYDADMARTIAECRAALVL